MQLDSKTEARVNKVLTKMPKTLITSSKQFVTTAVNSYIDNLIKEKVIPSV